MTDLNSQRTYVIGTAGHIDHGKSTLVKALTGIDPDRLAEEKARGMTIDLGFAWLRTPAGASVGVVDVPGHERFIKTMLAGVGGIDAALLVVDAGEGPMPQTLEHLAILDLLHVQSGVVALTKSDTVDREWLDLMTEEIREILAGTRLADAAIVPVSAITGDGLDDLLTELDRLLAPITRTFARSIPRLPIDRVFSIAGFGTVVTGTLIGGELITGQEVQVMPSGRLTRIRGLQSHSTKVERASPGARVAVNLAGLAVAELQRGDVVTAPKPLTAAHRLDIRLELLPDAGVAIEQNDGIDFFTGSAELPAWVTLLDRERLDPGKSGWAQLRFRQPIAVLKGDRFIVRRASPSQTIGGGEVIDANPIRHKRFRPEILASLETLAMGSPDELILQRLSDGPAEIRNLIAELSPGLSAPEIDVELVQLIADGAIVASGATPLNPTDFVMTGNGWRNWVARLKGALNEFHRANPLRSGVPRELLRAKLNPTSPIRLFDALLKLATAREIALDEGATVRAAGFKITLDPQQDELARRYRAALVAAPFAPPSPSDLGIDPALLGALVELGQVVKIADGVVFDPEAYRTIETGTLELIERNGSITMAELRDHFQTSRKYAQAALEYMDERRITRRTGDTRIRYAGVGAGVPVGRGT